MVDFFILMVSLAALIIGADLIIKQSEKIAIKFGFSEYLIGATLIAFGTSLPEMAASISASLHKHPELAVSNIIGSNFLNISLVLGAVLLLAKGGVKPDRDFFKKDSSWALFPVLFFIAVALDNEINRVVAFSLLLLMFGYVLFLIRYDKANLDVDLDDVRDDFIWPKVLILSFIGFVLVVKGADYTVLSASNLAKSFGVSEWVIGVLLVAFGTSLPELVVSIVAAIKGKADMAIGNVIGSNMANITVALGLSAMARPIVMDFSKYSFDIALMTIATFMLVFITANKMYTKPAGISLLAMLIIFINHLFNTGVAH